MYFLPLPILLSLAFALDRFSSSSPYLYVSIFTYLRTYLPVSPYRSLNHSIYPSPPVWTHACMQTCARRGTFVTPTRSVRKGPGPGTGLAALASSSRPSGDGGRSGPHWPLSDSSLALTQTPGGRAAQCNSLNSRHLIELDCWSAAH